MSRIRHATEEFVNNLIRGINQLISTNTEQIKVLLNEKAPKNNAEFTGIMKLNSKELITIDQAMVKHPFLNSGDLKAYIKSLDNSCTFYVHGNCTNTPEPGAYFLCQVFCHTNQVGYSDKHIELQCFSSRKQYYADSWNREAIEWKEYAAATKTEFLLTPPSGFSVADNFSNKCFIDGVGNIHLNFCWKKTDSSDITGLIIANLPTSISPIYRTIGYMTQWNNSNDYDYQIGMFYVDNISNGRLVCHVAKQCKVISGYVCFRRE